MIPCMSVVFCFSVPCGYVRCSVWGLLGFWAFGFGFESRGLRSQGSGIWLTVVCRGGDAFGFEMLV